MKEVKLDEDIDECLRAILKRSSFIVNEEVYVKAYSRISVDDGKDGRVVVASSNYYQMEKDFSDLVEKILISSGISRRLKGYMYIVECCNLINHSNMYGYLITKDIYPELARNFNVSNESIEHAIRVSITSGWERRAMLGYDEYCIWKRFNRRPSNRDFIDAVFSTAFEKADSNIIY